VAVTVLAVVPATDYFKRKRRFSERTACIGTLIRLNLAKVVYAEDHGLTNGAVVPDEVIWRQEGGVHQCFSGGTYLINPVVCLLRAVTLAPCGGAVATGRINGARRLWLNERIEPMTRSAACMRRTRAQSTRSVPAMPRLTPVKISTIVVPRHGGYTAS
jgi:hypothetical protein